MTKQTLPPQKFRSFVDKIFSNEKLIFSILGAAFLIPLAKIALTGEYNSSTVKIGHGPNKPSEIYYRMVETKDENGKLVEANHLDSLQLSMDADSGAALNRWALIGIKNCYAPSIRHISPNGQTNWGTNMPTVQCTAWDGETIYLIANDKLRQAFLRIESSGKHAIIKGKSIGIRAGSPAILVEDLDAQL